MYAYGRDVLLAFARWMTRHERPYLDKPDRLEYPTETWPAQEIRKSEVFDYAARHADGVERATFLERAEYFFRYSTTTLKTFPTRTLARPVVLMLVHGDIRAQTVAHGVVEAPRARTGARATADAVVFVPQRTRATQRAKAVASIGGGALAIGLLKLALGWLHVP
jgi:hypothetical protein